MPMSTDAQLCLANEALRFRKKQLAAQKNSQRPRRPLSSEYNEIADRLRECSPFRFTTNVGHSTILKALRRRGVDAQCSRIGQDVLITYLGEIR